jgi:hypothetical protein
MLVSNLNRHRQFFVRQQINVISTKNKARLDLIGCLGYREHHRWPLCRRSDCLRVAQFGSSISSNAVARASPASVADVRGALSVDNGNRVRGSGF